MQSTFSSTREVFAKLVPPAVNENNIDEIEKAWLKVDASDQDKRNVLDSVLKDYALEISTSIEAVSALVNLAVSLGKAFLCSASTPVVLLSDVLDIFTLTDCEILFSFIEKNVGVWKDELLFSACKNNLLRMCNDLLRRLSRSQNTVFRGRILLFLASCFPVSERSGLNLVSEFNLENISEYKKELEDESMEEEEEANGEILRVDYNLYNKFLTLQDFFRNPTQCYNKLRWGSFIVSWNDTFQTFQNLKLDEVHFKRKTPREHLADSAVGAIFFAKYMTNPRLLQLQLRDTNFRRSLIVQGLVTLQYLNSPVKSKLETFELRPVQQEWVKEQETMLYNLLAESPKGSERFRDMVRHMLLREQLWNNWKNDGCPEFKKPGVVEEVENDRPKHSLKRKSAGDLLKNAACNNKYFMGTKELSRLWNLNTDNVGACLGDSRAFVPSLESYLGEAIAQMDPKAGIEPQYKKVNDPNFGWRALRLLSQRSPCFFTQVDNPITKLPDYIELNLKRLLKEQPSLGGEEIDLIKEEGEDDQKEQVQPHREESKMCEEALEGVATRLGEQWLKVAAKLGYKSHSKAIDMLKTWSAEDEDATPENLAYLLEGLGLLEAAEYLKEKWCKTT